MNYWLLKSEPNVWSIDQQIKAGKKGAPWDGVRNCLLYTSDAADDS